MRKVVINTKYTALVPENADDPPFQVLRYDQSWRILTGDKFILTMVNEIETLRHVIYNLRKQVNNVK